MKMKIMIITVVTIQRRMMLRNTSECVGGSDPENHCADDHGEDTEN